MITSSLKKLGLTMVIALGSMNIGCAQNFQGDESTTRTSLSERAQNFRRPYGNSAHWNIPVHGLPRHPDSDYYTNLLWNEAPDRSGNFNLSFDTYTYPVYSAEDATMMIPARTRWGGNLQGELIPWHPSWRAAPGSDAQVIILDHRNGREWNLFQVKPRGDYVDMTNGNLIPGDYRTNTNGYPPSRGIGIPYLAMLVRPEEIAAGRIEHALSMPIANPSGVSYVPPATKLEHATGRRGIPLGMRYALDVTEEEIQTWLAKQRGFSDATRRTALIIARALRDYGWFVTDGAGSAHFQFEANVSAAQDWVELGLAEKHMGARSLPRDLMDGLITQERIYVIVPSNQYR